MSVVSIGSSNVKMGNQGTFGGTAQLSNLWMGTTNISLDTIWKTKIFPRGAGSSNFGTFRSSKYRVIRLNSNDYAKGNVSFIYPTVVSNTGASSGDNYAWDYNAYAYVTIRATPVYPYTFQRWETLTPLPAGTSLSTSADVNLYATDWLGNFTVRAVFA